MEKQELINLLDRLISLNKENETVEFKKNFHSKEEIGERISAISNSACLMNQPYGYLVYGVENDTHEVVGTTFRAKSHMAGNEELELWLLNRLSPKIDFLSYEFDYQEDVHISIYKIPAAENVPVKFINVSYIRVNSSTQKLVAYPEKEKQIWKKDDADRFLSNIAKKNVGIVDITKYLSTETYFDLMKLPYPSSLEKVVERFIEEGFVSQYDGQYSITNLGAILLAKKLSDFSGLQRKSIRVITYKGKNKVETERDVIGDKGYALGFEGAVDWISGQLPANEEIGRVLRAEVRMYPEIAIREIVANSLIHQDFSVKGCPTIEIFSDRIEFSNAGVPVIRSERFIDEYNSRNEKLAGIMRRMGFCEEKGSGMDKAVFHNELYQLPAIKITVNENKTIVTLFAYQPLSKMDRDDRIRACYQHACLKYVSNDKMTNRSLRERFGIEEQNSAIASRIIKEALDAGAIKEDDPTATSKKFRKYAPFWA